MPNQNSDPISVIPATVPADGQPIGKPAPFNPLAGFAGRTSRRFRVTGTDVYFKGKVYPEGSIVNFNDNHLNKYLIPLVEDEIKPEDKILDTPVSPASTDSPLEPLTAASRRRGRPRQP
jgi:hypothetical protein